MVISSDFVKSYNKLHRERESGENIWTLCQMSAIAHEAGDAVDLARDVILDVDTIYYRSNAWLAWSTFLEVEDLRDDAGIPIDDVSGDAHLWVRSRLS